MPGQRKEQSCGSLFLPGVAGVVAVQVVDQCGCAAPGVPLPHLKSASGCSRKFKVKRPLLRDSWSCDAGNPKTASCAGREGRKVVADRHYFRIARNCEESNPGSVSIVKQVLR